MDIDGKFYYVQSVFIGNEDIKSVVSRLAERKTMREMGLDIPIKNGGT